MVLNSFLRREAVDSLKALLKRKRRVTVLADRNGFHPKTLKSMIRQSGLTEEELFEKNENTYGLVIS